MDEIVKLITSTSFCAILVWNSCNAIVVWFLNNAYDIRWNHCTPLVQLKLLIILQLFLCTDLLTLIRLGGGQGGGLMPASTFNNSQF